MEALVILLLFCLFSFLAYRHGYDSRPKERSQEERLADVGFHVDDKTTSVATNALGTGTVLTVLNGNGSQVTSNRAA